VSIVPQYSTETADASGAAVFTFPAPPQGETWSGSVAIPGAPSSTVGTVMVGGSLVGSLNGSGFYGPFTALAAQILSIAVTGLTPSTQFQAVWHADTNALSPPTPTPAVAVVGASGAGVAAVGLMTKFIIGLAGNGGSNLPEMPAGTFYSWGYILTEPEATEPTDGDVQITLRSTGAGISAGFDSLSVTERGSNRLSGAQFPACAGGTLPGMVIYNGTDQTLTFYVNYGPPT
jgi:hypothetical protein